LGYTAEVAVSDDHLIVAQRVHQATNDNASLVAMTEATELANGDPAPEMNHRQQLSTPGLQQLRERLRGPTLRSRYARRKAFG
jgi:hypothetical protein